MKAFVLKYNCDSYDFSCSTNLKVFLIKERALETKKIIENTFKHFASSLDEKLKIRDILVQKEKAKDCLKTEIEKKFDEINNLYAKEAQEIFKDFLIQMGDLKEFFRKEHLALHEEYSFDIEEVDFEGE